jgi:alpha-tubulin suppressor-like RCC1 family protein
MGSSHSVVVTEDRKVYVFGKNSYGSLGLGIDVQRVLEPTQVGLELSSAARSVCASDYNTVVLESKSYTDSGHFWGCGYGGSSRNLFARLAMTQSGGALGVLDNDRYDFSVMTITQMKQVAIGTYHAIGITQQNTIELTGRGEYGILGTGRTKELAQFTRNPFFLQLGEVLPVKVVACSFYSMALMDDGSVYAWGRNDEGQLGIGSSAGIDMYETQNSPMKLDFGGRRVKDLEAGENTAVFLTEQNEVFVTGCKLWWNPQQLGLAGPVTSIFAGGRFAGYVVEERNVYCVGGMFNSSQLQEMPALKLWKVKSEVFYNKRVLKVGGAYRNHYCILSD